MINNFTFFLRHIHARAHIYVYQYHKEYHHEDSNKGTTTDSQFNPIELIVEIEMKKIHSYNRCNLDKAEASSPEPE